MIKHCSPTLASIKTGSLFRCRCSDPTELKRWIRRMNRKLTCKGLRIIPLRVTSESALIYVYRPGKLQADLSSSDAEKILCPMGYHCAHPERCVARLAGKCRQCGEFPHEIGLFLGYPPEDVQGFMADAKGCKCCGTWKVYGNEEKAKHLFAQYQKCTDVYMRQHKLGNSIERLTVAV